MISLCQTCLNVRKVVSGTGSEFLLCQLSQTDKRLPKYPPQPIVRCDVYEPQSPSHSEERGVVGGENEEQ